MGTIFPDDWSSLSDRYHKGDKLTKEERKRVEGVEGQTDWNKEPHKKSLFEKATNKLSHTFKKTEKLFKNKSYTDKILKKYGVKTRLIVSKDKQKRIAEIDEYFNRKFVDFRRLTNENEIYFNYYSLIKTKLEDYGVSLNDKDEIVDNNNEPILELLSGDDFKSFIFSQKNIIGISEPAMHGLIMLVVGIIINENRLYNMINESINNILNNEDHCFIYNPDDCNNEDNKVNNDCCKIKEEFKKMEDKFKDFTSTIDIEKNKERERKDGDKNEEIETFRNKFGYYGAGGKNKRKTKKKKNQKKNKKTKKNKKRKTKKKNKKEKAKKTQKKINN